MKDKCIMGDYFIMSEEGHFAINIHHVESFAVTLYQTAQKFAVVAKMNAQGVTYTIARYDTENEAMTALDIFTTTRLNVLPFDEYRHRRG